MKLALKPIFGERTFSSSNVTESAPIEINQEAVFYTSGPKYKRFNTASTSQNTSVPIGTHPLNKFGKRQTCVVCRSEFHWASMCPDNPKW